MVSLPQEEEGSKQWERSQGWTRALKVGSLQSKWEALSREGAGGPGTEAPGSTACYPHPGTAQSRVITAECRLCPGWLRPTFVPNSDGTVAAGEGLVLAREPNRHVPGLRERESKAQRTEESMQGGQGWGGHLCHWEHGTHTACTPPAGQALLAA